ncbi:MAG: hypothetical protein E7660_07250 [Ruminococcaceae bacterium]|nr:hypothetical protein [Oscillospiraceae bacterium]
MRGAAFSLLVLAGASFSVISLRDAREKLKELSFAQSLSERLYSEIENFRTPVGKILEPFENDDLNAENLADFFDRACADGGKAKQLIITLTEKNYPEAVTAAKLLWEHTKELCEKAQSEYTARRPARVVFPIAVGVLVGIILI